MGLKIQFIGEFVNIPKLHRYNSFLLSIVIRIVLSIKFKFTLHL